MITVAELMTSHPVCVQAHDSIQRAAQLMDDLNVGSLPVCHGHRLLGIVTDRDITVRATAAGLNAAQTRVDAVMSQGVRHCSPDQTAAEVLVHMCAVQIRRLPVLDDEGRLVGIVSLGDLAARGSEGVQEALRRISSPAAPDRLRKAA